MKRIAILTTMIGVLFAFGAVNAGASTSEPYVSSGIHLNTATPTAGGPLTVTVDGCKPNQDVAISIASSQVGTPTANANGEAMDTVTVPAGLAAGSAQTVTAVCTDVSSSDLTQKAPITIAAASTTSGSGTAGNGSSNGSMLPQTGAQTALLAGIGLMLIAAGTGVVLAVRRRLQQA